jgi:hypothetical protein
MTILGSKMVKNGQKMVKNVDFWQKGVKKSEKMVVFEIRKFSWLAPARISAFFVL